MVREGGGAGLFEGGDQSRLFVRARLGSSEGPGSRLELVSQGIRPDRRQFDLRVQHRDRTAATVGGGEGRNSSAPGRTGGEPAGNRRAAPRSRRLAQRIGTEPRKAPANP